MARHRYAQCNCSRIEYSVVVNLVALQERVEQGGHVFTGVELLQVVAGEDTKR